MREAQAGTEDLATRQARLQKALSTAYLNHQIAELENKVKSTTLKATAEQFRPRNSGQLQQGALATTAAAPAVIPNAGNGPGAVESRAIADPPNLKDMNDDLGRPDDLEADELAAGHEDDEWRVVVIDVSALMWAKNAVKRLVQKGWEIIVPLEAIRTLDLLKKGSSASAVAARQAARYIEHALRYHSLLSSDPSITVQTGTNYKKGRGVRLQREDEVRPVDAMIDELALPPMDGEESLPGWVESIFSCVSYFKRVMDAEDSDVEDDYEREQGPILYIANPPVFVEVEQGRAEPTPSARDGEKGRDGVDYLARGEGHVVLQEAARFDLTLEVLRDDDVEVEASGLGRSGKRTGRARNGGDGGKRSAEGCANAGGERGTKGGKSNRGGRGDRKGGRREGKKESEPEREVKILLRRPQTPPSAPASPLLASRQPLDSGNSVQPRPGNSPVIPGQLLQPRIDGSPFGVIGRPPPPKGLGSLPRGPSSQGLGPAAPQRMNPQRPPAPLYHSLAQNHAGSAAMSRPAVENGQNRDLDQSHISGSRGERRGGLRGGEGGRGRNGRNGKHGGGGGEFVLLQRPESLVRESLVRPPPPSGPMARIDAPVTSLLVNPDRKRDRREKERAEAPKVVLLQRPRG
ncbi:hypothetical protein IAR55_002345 [Kwoniella newhampshirensis]|uniref:PIN domain-containing protein n=1 Tax=Kwoniella newhampshirensis TaxID=1651941 RepID=A0AAW0Z133_9TREE